MAHIAHVIAYSLLFVTSKPLKFKANIYRRLPLFVSPGADNKNLKSTLCVSSTPRILPCANPERTDLVDWALKEKKWEKRASFLRLLCPE